MAGNNKDQIAVAERIQDLLLKRWEKALTDDTMTAAEVAVVTKMLRDSGWSVDPTRLPQTVRDKLTALVDPNKFSDDDEEALVVGKIA